MSYYLVDPERLAKARGEQPVVPSLGNAQPAQPQPMPATPGNEWQSLKDKWGVDRADAPQGLDAAAPGTTAPPAKTLADLAPRPVGNPLDVLPTGVTSPTTVTRQDPQSLGMMDRSGTVTGADGVTRGWNDGAAEQFKTRYDLSGPGKATGFVEVTGNKPVGGGTLSAPDQGNGGTVEGNVAALNRQTAALTSLREAQNPGITTGTGAYAPQAAPVNNNPFALPGDKYGDDKFRQANYESLLSQAGSQRGFGASKRAAAMINSAKGLLEPGLEAMKLQGEQTKSLMDLQQRQQMTPYQQASLGIARGNQQVAQDQKQAKSLLDLGKGLADDPRYSNYMKSKNYMAMLDEQRNSTNPSDHARMATTVMQLARPDSEPNDSGINLLEQSTGDLWDRVTGPVKQAFGYSRYSDEQRGRLYDTGKNSFTGKENEGYAAIDDYVKRIVAKGGNPTDYLNPTDLELWNRRQQQPTQQAQAAYRWDGQKLVPVK